MYADDGSHARMGKKGYWGKTKRSFEVCAANYIAVAKDYSQGKPVSRPEYAEILFGSGYAASNPDQQQRFFEHKTYTGLELWITVKRGAGTETVIPLAPADYPGLKLLEDYMALRVTKITGGYTEVPYFDTAYAVIRSDGHIVYPEITFGTNGYDYCRTMYFYIKAGGTLESVDPTDVVLNCNYFIGPFDPPTQG